MNSDIIVSIVIPVYNGIKYIGNCGSAIRQLKHKYQIIIVDDGSSDGSFSFCKNMFGNNNDISVFHKENGGIASARNYGLKYANGK